MTSTTVVMLVTIVTVVYVRFPLEKMHKVGVDQNEYKQTEMDKTDRNIEKWTETNWS